MIRLLEHIALVLLPDLWSVKAKIKIAPFLELKVGVQPEPTAEDNILRRGHGDGKKEMEDMFEGIFRIFKFQVLFLQNQLF